MYTTHMKGVQKPVCKTCRHNNDDRTNHIIG